MNSNLTDITLIVDRSGSMASCRSDMEGGLNTFIARQAKEPGDALLTLVQFDTEYEIIHSGRRIQDVPPYELAPRGNTALLDAVGRAIDETGRRLSRIPEEERPGLVMMVIVTDGLENSSREFTGEQIKATIEHQTSKYNWQFTYLGANQDAFAVSSAMGIAPSSTMNYDAASSSEMMASVGSYVARYRRAVAEAPEGCAPPAPAFTPAERSAAVGKR